MKRKPIYLLAAAAFVAACTIAYERDAAAQCNNGKACNGVASCTHPCQRQRIETGIWICYIAEAHPTPGKKCGNGAATDNCLDDDEVNCARTKLRECPAGLNCAAPHDATYDDQNMGCV